MTIFNLNKMFAPRSVALFGASARPGSVGNVLTRNLLESGFEGSVWLVNPKGGEIEGIQSYKSAEELPLAPDLAVIATPPATVPGVMEDLAKKGTKATVIITAGIRNDKALDNKMQSIARKNQIRIQGPNCIGLMIPGIGLNASFAHKTPLAGNLAFVSQSGAIITSVLDWANGRGIGFSYMVSLGDMSDVDIADTLDYMASDHKTSAILMYIEQISDAKKFMSAAKAAARIKPIVVIKSGRHEAGAAAAASHTGALAGADNVYGAAFERSGILRVTDLEELFHAAEILSRQKPVSGDHLAIVTNGGGAGVLAVDRLEDYNGNLSALEPETVEALNKVLPDSWSHMNPVDIIGDAPAERYEESIELTLADPNVDAVLVMNCPTALADSLDAARSTIKAVESYNKKHDRQKIVLTNWLGEVTAREARALFSENNIPTFNTPADAIRGFSYLTRHVKAQEKLMRAPPSLPEDYVTDSKAAQRIISEVLDQNRQMLTEPEAKSVMEAYGIPVVPTFKVDSPEAVYDAAGAILKDGPYSEVVIKILSEDISHKSDAGGVALDLPSAQAAQEEAHAMLERITKMFPKAKIDGFTVQPMIRRTNAHELIVGVSEDRTFGPVLLFGAGGTAVEVIADRAVTLPPLDLKLAEDLIGKTNIYKLLLGYRDRPPANMEAIALTLVRISQMIVDNPEIHELDINPLMADDKGVIALDARILAKKVKGPRTGENPRLSIRPYPKELEEYRKLKSGGEVFIRPIRPEDEVLYDTFTEKTDPEDQRMRLFKPVKKLPREFIARLTQIDYARAMAFVALDIKNGELLGVSRLASDPDLVRAEFGVIVRSDMKNKGIGTVLMEELIDYTADQGISELWGNVLAENTEMLSMCRKLGFAVEHDHEDPQKLLVCLKQGKRKVA